MNSHSSRSTESSEAIEASESIQYFLEDMEYHGRNERTTAAYQRVLLDFKEFVNTQFGKEPIEVEYRDCMAWTHELRRDHSTSTVATYASYLNRFYNYLQRIDHYDDNPMELVLEEMDETIDSNPSRRDISVIEMRKFVDTVTHPLHRAIIITLLKTGIRAGELCNLDLMDLDLDHDVQYWNSRAQLSQRPNSLFVSDSHTYGQQSGGEQRTASNKRKRETMIPIDEELKKSLIQWFAIRPDIQSETKPVFVGTVERWGERITPDMIHHIVEKNSREYGWYRTGGGAAENVTPHYFRHFFTTHLRDRTGDRGVVKYLRGDVASDVIDTYTHNWGNRIRETYLNNIYTLEMEG